MEMKPTLVQPQTAVATRSTDAPQSPISAIKAGLELMKPQFRVSLPSHISPEKFERTVLTAMNNTPDLLNADKRSLFNACSKAAQDGLLPDGREGALVIFKDKTGKKLVTWMPMVAGLVKKIRQSGEIESIGAKIVYQKEIDDGKFEFLISDGRETLRHQPMLWGDRGAKVLVYAYARYKSGYVEYYPIHADDIEKRRKASRSQTGPWQSWTEEMWLKTAIRGIAKRLPISAEVVRAVERDVEPTQFEAIKGEAMQSIEAAAAQFGATAEDYDAETGEFTDETNATTDA